MRLLQKLQSRRAMRCSGVFVITAFLLMATVMLRGASTPAQAQDAPVPPAPTELTATVVGATRIDLSWKRPDTDIMIYGYNIESSVDGQNDWIERYLVSHNGVATKVSFEDLSLGDTRHYRVCAIYGATIDDEILCGDYSTIVVATTANAAPGRPTGLTVTANGSTRIDLSWNVPSNDGGVAIIGYKIEVSSDGSNWSGLVADTGTTAATYSHTGLSSGATRYYRVSAINSVGTGAASEVASATAADTVPGRPTGLTATANGSTRIDLSWTAPVIAGGVPIDGYKIEVSSNGSNWSGLVADTGNTDTTYSHTGLSGGNTRHYRVSAINSVGTGAASEVASATTPDAAPGAPTNLTLTVRSDRIDLAWTAPAKDGGTYITGYVVEISSDGGLNWPSSIVVEGRYVVPTTFSHTGLSLGDTRHYRVLATNSLGNGPASNVAHGTTATVTPAAPTRLTATAKNGPTRIELSWTAPADNGGVAIIGYKIEVSSDGSNWSDLVADTGTTAITYSHTDLSGGDTRHYRVSAINSIGTGSASGVANATTDIVVPGRPTDLTVTDVQPTWVDLSWTAPADNSGAPISRYVVQVSSDRAFNQAGLHFVPSDGNNLLTTFRHTVETGLVPGETHYYRVIAANSVGIGLPSNVVSAIPRVPRGVSTEVELTVSLSSVEEDAAGTGVTVTGTLNRGARAEATTVTVSVGASTDRATEGTDYTAVNDLTLTIDAGETAGTATFTLTPTDDLLGEGDETISVTGTTPDSGLSVTKTKLTITDDEVVSTEVELTVSLSSVAEDAGGTGVTVTGTLNGGARAEATTVTVLVGASTDRATEGTDYTAVNDLTLTIDAGETSGTATFTLTPTDDPLGEGDETISVTGTTPDTGLSVRGTELTITDDEVVSTEVELTVGPRSVAEDAGGTSVMVTGTLNGGARTTETQVTVTVGAAGDEAVEGTDYATVNDLTLTIDAGQSSGTATFTLTPTNDTLGEGGEQVSVTGSTTVSGLSVSGTELTITDDDSASTEVELTAGPRSVAENGGGTVVTVTGTLDGAARTGSTTVTVTVGATADSATAGTDYARVNDFTLTIDAGQRSGTATFTLTPTNDTLGEGGEQVSVTGSTPVSGLSVSGTELTILDDDSASAEVELTASPRSVAENGGGTVVTVTGTLDGGARTEATTVIVSVGATGDSATEGTDYAAVADLTLTIDAGQPSGTATFTLTPTNDTVGEGGEEVSVTGSTPVSGLSVSGTELTILDDDSASTEVELTASPRSVTENGGGTAVTVTGTLDGGARTEATTVTVTVGATGDSATEGTDYAAVADFTLTIDAGQPTGTATFTLTPTNDTVGEGGEEVSVTGSTPVSGLSVSGYGAGDPRRRQRVDGGGVDGEPSGGGGERRGDGGDGDGDAGRRGADGGDDGNRDGGRNGGFGNGGHGLRGGGRPDADDRRGAAFGDGDVHADADQRHGG